MTTNRSVQLAGSLYAATPDIIGSFDGTEYDFLSNFHPSQVLMDDDGSMVPTVEHAFQAEKAMVPSEREAIIAADNPGLAKHLGRTCLLRHDWETVKVDIMRRYVRQKFTLHRELGDQLLATGTALLVEGNIWRDDFWGVCNGKGLNWLGLILMETRNELRVAG